MQILQFFAQQTTFFKHFHFLACLCVAQSICRAIFLAVVADPGARAWTYWKTVLLKIRLFSPFVVDFILGSFLFTHIEIIILKNKKYFLHCALLFLLLVIKQYFCCSEWANELHDISSARPSGLAKYYLRSELSVFITSQLKIKLMPE